LKSVRNLIFPCLFAVSGAIISGCGNYDTTTPPVSQPTATKRAFVVNQFNNVVDVIDSAKDLPTGATLQVNQNSDSIIVLSNKKSIVHSIGGNTLVELDNATETLLGTVNSFPGVTDSIVPSQDGLFAYAAIPNLGKISKMDLTTQALTSIPADTATPALIPGVRHLAITHNGNTILAFSDNSNDINFVDRTNSDVLLAPLVDARLDRPVTALFSSDDSTAYVLNCGAECGDTTVGAHASIAVVNMATRTITASVPVRAATAGLINGTTLYVAGSNPSLPLGQLDVVNLTSLAPAMAVATPISDGKHTRMALAANNKLYIGAQACSASNGNCLSVYNTSSGAASIVAASSIVPSGDVTAVTPIVGRNVVYVIQNGQLVIYDTSTDLPQATQIFIPGRVSDVKEVDN
jgi:hypothetical protein